MKKITLLLASMLLCAGVYAQHQLFTQDLTQLEGSWKGTIEYYDYKKAKKDITMQTELTCQIKNNSLVFKFVYWDENGEYIKRTEKLEILSGGRQLKDSQLWTVDKLSKDQSTGEMVLELLSNDSDNSKAQSMKKTIAVSNKKLSITKNEVGDSDTVLYSFNFDKTVHKF